MKEQNCKLKVENRKCVPKAHLSLGPRPRALVPELFRYPSAFPWGKGDHVVVDEGNPLLQIWTG